MDVNKVISVLVISGLLMPLELPLYLVTEVLAAEPITVAPTSETAIPADSFAEMNEGASDMVDTMNALADMEGPVDSEEIVDPPAEAPPPPTETDDPLVDNTPFTDDSIIQLSNVIVEIDPVTGNVTIIDNTMTLVPPVDPPPAPPVPDIQVILDPTTGNVTIGPLQPPPPPFPTILEILDVNMTPPPTFTLADILGLPVAPPPAPLPPAVVITTLPEDMTTPIFSEE